jgi:hypothetical protein
MKIQFLPLVLICFTLYSIEISGWLIYLFKFNLSQINRLIDNVHLIVALHRNLRYYEVLHTSNFEHRVVKRGAQYSYHPYNKISELDFYTHGK